VCKLFYVIVLVECFLEFVSFFPETCIVFFVILRKTSEVLPPCIVETTYKVLELRFI